MEGKLGFAFSDRGLIYVHGGGAWADVGVRGFGSDGPWTDIHNDDVVKGWTVGIGGEYRMTQDISIFAEGAFFNFNDEEFTNKFGPEREIAYDTDLRTIKGGVIFRFDSFQLEFYSPRKSPARFGAVIVEASTAEEARKIIRADLDVGPGSYDHHLEAVESRIGDVTVAVENRHDPLELSPSLAS